MAESMMIDIINRTVAISTLPEVTMRIIQVVQDPRSTAHDLHEIVGNDPVLSARVLRVVNSAFYGLPGQIGSIDRAIMLLGLNAVKNIAIASSLTKMFKGKVVCDDFSGKDLWTHSVAVGATNKLITGAIGLSLPDESFLAGLIHDLGLVAIMQAEPEKLREVVEHTKDGLTFRRVEQEILGTDHQEVGAALAARWKFPRSFQYVAGHHHNPTDLARENRLLVVVTHISDVVCARKQEVGLSIMAETEEADESLLEEIGLSRVQLQDISENIEEELQVVRALVE